MIDEKRCAEMELVFERLLAEIDRLLSECPEAEQAIAVQTAKGNLYAFANRNVMKGDRTDEDSFLDMLESKGELQLQCIACKWHERMCGPEGSNVELTSAHFRERLLAARPENEEALHLANGGDCLYMRKLKDLK